MVCTKRAAPPYLNGREGYSECWANTELGLNWIVEMWKYARGDKEMSSLWKQWNISPCVIWWRTDLQSVRCWPWRGSSPSWPGPRASGGTGNITALTSVSTLSSLSTQMASRWLQYKSSNKLPIFSAQAGRHNKYIVKKARWEEHLRTMKEEEDMITEIYRQYKVMTHHSPSAHVTLYRGSRRRRGGARAGRPCCSVWKWPPSPPWCSRCPHSCSLQNSCSTSELFTSIPNY